MNEAWLQQPEVTEFTPEELEQYLALQKKVGWRRTGTPAFESFFPILPFTPSEQALVRERDGIKEVLMWRRKDAHYDGWHMAGGYILRGESDEEWVSRVIKKETDLTLKKFFQIRRFNTRPETGWVPNHQMAVFFLCSVEGEPSVGKFFPIYPKPKLPGNILGHHVKYLDCLRAHFMRMATMRKYGIRFDYTEKAPQWQWRVMYQEERFPTMQIRTRLYDAMSLDDALIFFKSNGGVRIIDDQGLQIF